MKLVKDYYAELLSLTQLFLLREHSLKDVKMVDPAIIDFFQRKAKPSSSSSTLKKVQPAPIPIPEVQKNKNPTYPAPPPPPDSRSLHQKSPSSQPLTSPAQPDPVLPPQPPVNQDQDGHPSVNLNAFSRDCDTPAAQFRDEGHIKSISPSSQNCSVGTPECPPKGSQSDRKIYEMNRGKEFHLEPLAPPSPQENSEWWNLSQTLFPEWMLSKTIPSDAIAQKNKNAWLRSQEISPVIILSFHDNEQRQTFLKNIAQAISLRLAPAQVISVSQIEKENGWENTLNSPQLRLIIASDYGLYLHPKLMHLYREIPQQGKHFLNQTPLLLLSDLSLYLKEPQLKPLLWRAICNEFAASQSHRRPEK